STPPSNCTNFSTANFQYATCRFVTPILYSISKSSSVSPSVSGIGEIGVARHQNATPLPSAASTHQNPAAAHPA
ncbi:MAG: hypothetical protein ACK4SA_15495, partial [Caldilinea sp.]